MKKALLFITGYLVCITAFAQGTYTPLGSDTYDYIDRIDIKYGRILPSVHTSTKPYIRSETARMAEALHSQTSSRTK